MSVEQYLSAIEEAFLDLHEDGDYQKFARAVEAALRSWRGYQ